MLNIYNDLNIIFSNLEEKDARFSLEWLLGLGFNFKSGNDFFKAYNLENQTVKSEVDVILSFCEKNNLIRIPDSFIGQDNIQKFTMIGFESNSFKLDFDTEFFQSNNTLYYWMKNSNYSGDEFKKETPPGELLEFIANFPQINDYKKEYIHNLASIILFVKNKFPFISKQEIYSIAMNLRFNANEDGELDEDLENCSLCGKHILTESDISQSIENDELFKYTTLTNDIMAFKEFKLGWFDNNLDGQGYNHNFLNLTNQILINLLLNLNENHQIDIQPKQVFIYPDPDGEISIEMDILDNLISLSFNFNNETPSVFVHSLNTKTNKATYKTFELATIDLKKKFTKNEEITIFLKHIIQGDI